MYCKQCARTLYRRHQAQSDALGLSSLMTTSVMQDLATESLQHSSMHWSPHATVDGQGLPADQHAPCRMGTDWALHGDGEGKAHSSFAGPRLSVGRVHAHASSSIVDGIAEDGVSVTVDGTSHMQNGHAHDATYTHQQSAQQRHSQHRRNVPSADAYAKLTYIVPAFERADSMPVPSVISPPSKMVQKKALLLR